MSELSRLRWLCRRGMKELDLLLQGYLENSYPDASGADQLAFKSILQLPDPELNDLILARTQSADEAVNRVIKNLRNSFSD